MEAVAKLASDAEAVGGVTLSGLRVAWGGRAVEEGNVVWPVLEPLAEQVDRAALADLALETRQELPPCRPVLSKVQGVGYFRLGLAQEGRKLGEIHAILSVVGLRRAADPARAVGGRPLADGAGRNFLRIAGRVREGRTDQALEATLGGVGGHASTSSGRCSASSASISPVSPSASASSRRSGSLAWSGNRSAASRTSSLPVTTSAISAARNSRSRAISTLVDAIAFSHPSVASSR